MASAVRNGQTMSVSPKVLNWNKAHISFLSGNNKVGVLTTVGSPCLQQSITVITENSMGGNLSAHNLVAAV